AALEGREDRRVRYVAELVAIAPDGAELHARGELTGTLATAPRGDGGFGYDPAFVPDGETRTVAEMSPEEKDAMSHRARAPSPAARLSVPGTGQLALPFGPASGYGGFVTCRLDSTKVMYPVQPGP